MITNILSFEMAAILSSHNLYWLERELQDLNPTTMKDQQHTFPCQDDAQPRGTRCTYTNVLVPLANRGLAARVLCFERTVIVVWGSN